MAPCLFFWPCSTLMTPPSTGTVLVTGAAGFIGSHVCEALLRRGQTVVGLDNFDPYDDAIKLRKSDEFRRTACSTGRFEFVQWDICDAPAVRSLLERTKPEGIIHLAAKVGVRPSIADPAGYSRANVYGTSVMLEESR